MPSWCGRVSRLKDACHACIMFDSVHAFINVHHAVLVSSFSIPIKGIFVETLLKCHGTSSNYKPNPNTIIHRRRTLSHEMGQRCACMHRNLTWLEKTHAFIVWEGFRAKGCMSCPHNLWDRPHFHQRSSCSLIVIIRHSHQQSLCQNSLEMSWNVFQL